MEMPVLWVGGCPILTPIEFHCPDCQCATVVRDDHLSREGPTYYIPTQCGYCGAKNPDARNVPREDWKYSTITEEG